MPENAAEKPIAFQSVSTRKLILLSYWAVFLVGIPLWWVTTSLTRLPLPEARVGAINSKQLSFVLNASVQSDALLANDVHLRLRDRIRSLGLDDAFAVSVVSQADDNAQTYTVVLDESTEETRLEKRRMVVGVKGESAASYSSLVSHRLESLWLGSTKPSREVVQYAPRYRLAFSLLTEDASAGDCPHTWEVKSAISRNIQPALTKLEALHNFTIESQVQYFAPLAFEPLLLEDGSFGLTQEQLSVFVNSAEWTLASSVSNDPVLHFLIFVPSAKRRPLRILDADSQPLSSSAFAIPQWGSIYIHNPIPSSDSTHLSSSALHFPFSIFRGQLLALLGVPPLSPEITYTGPEAISDWQLDALLRRRARENAEGSKDTLGSIVKLVKQLEGMPVGKDVTEDVKAALDALDRIYDSVFLTPLAALKHSAEALAHASRAFFNPSMLALLYFPPEHNLAVYTPLLAPVSVPLIANSLRELKRWWSARKAARAQVAASLR